MYLFVSQGTDVAGADKEKKALEGTNFQCTRQEANHLRITNHGSIICWQWGPVFLIAVAFTSVFVQTHMITPFSYGGNIITRDAALCCWFYIIMIFASTEPTNARTNMLGHRSCHNKRCSTSSKWVLTSASLKTHQELNPGWLMVTYCHGLLLLLDLHGICQKNSPDS